MFFPPLISGACIEFRTGGFDAQWTWERLRESGRSQGGKLTLFSAVPTIYMRLRRYFLEHIAPMDKNKTEEYVAGARALRACLCGTSALPQPISDFWAKLLGKRVVQRYGATEIGSVLLSAPGDAAVPAGSVGEITAGVDLKLAEGDEGEILVHSPVPALIEGHLGSYHLDAP